MLFPRFRKHPSTLQVSYKIVWRLSETTEQGFPSIRTQWLKNPQNYNCVLLRFNLSPRGTEKLLITELPGVLLHKELKIIDVR